MTKSRLFFPRDIHISLKHLSNILFNLNFLHNFRNVRFHSESLIIMHNLSVNTCSNYLPFFPSQTDNSSTVFFFENIKSTAQWMLLLCEFDDLPSFFTLFLELHKTNWCSIHRFVALLYKFPWIQNTYSFSIALRCWNGIKDTGRFNNKTKSNNNVIVWKTRMKQELVVCAES